MRKLDVCHHPSLEGTNTHTLSTILAGSPRRVCEEALRAWEFRLALQTQAAGVSGGALCQTQGQDDGRSLVGAIGRKTEAFDWTTPKCILSEWRNGSMYCPYCFHKQRLLHGLDHGASREGEVARRELDFEDRGPFRCESGQQIRTDARNDAMSSARSTRRRR